MNDARFPPEVIEVLAGLALMPYENLSKIVSHHISPENEKAMSDPEQLFRKAREAHQGGTCYSLTWWLYHRLLDLGYKTEFLLADKRVQPNIHCGLKFSFENRDYLMDPGYMIYRPLELPANRMSLAFDLPPNRIELADNPEENVWGMYTVTKSSRKHRFDFRKQPVDRKTFLEAWRESFSFPMMQYPVLNRVLDGTQIYLQKRNLLIRKAGESRMVKLQRPEFIDAVKQYFEIDEETIHKALYHIEKQNPGFFSK